MKLRKTAPACSGMYSMSAFVTNAHVAFSAATVSLKTCFALAQHRQWCWLINLHQSVASGLTPIWPHGQQTTERSLAESDAIKQVHYDVLARNST
jgi:hypothetical protein